MPPTTPPFPPASVRLLAPVLLALAAAASSARAAPLDGLPEAVRDAVVSACLPAQYRDGADAYRRCVEREAEARAGREPGALELLELDERYAVERRCGGALARSEIAGLDCIDAEIESLAAAPVPRLVGLREDERHALLRQCFEKQSNAGVAAWRDCMARGAESLRSVAEADLSGLDAIERNALQAGCASEPDATAYRRCVLESGAASGVRARADASTAPEPSPLDDDPVADPASTPGAERIALGRPASGSAASLGAALPDPAPPRRTPTPPSTPYTGPAVRPAQVEEEAGAGAEAGAEMRAGTPVGTPSADAPDALGDGAPEADGAAPASDGGIVTRLTDAYESLDGGARPLLWGALALPLLLMASSLLLRRGDAGARGDSARSAGAGLAERIGPTRGRPGPIEPGAPDAGSGPGARGVAPGHTARVRDRLHEEADDLFDALDRDLEPGSEPDEDPAHEDFDDESRAFGAYDEPVHGDAAMRGPHPDGDRDASDPAAPVPLDGPDRDAPTRLIARPTPPRHDAALDDEDASAAMPDVELAMARDARDDGPPDAPAAFAPRARAEAASGGFGAWLASRPDEDRRGLATEFLIYWMAWGDERYDPTTRDAVFSSDDPDDLTVVKRRVLEEDVAAFADTVRWIVLNASREARSQILELLVALLVTAPSPTPVQNTLLRFLADAFGLGATTLEDQFESAFDAPLPPLPRADRPDWWAGQDEAGLMRREGRTLAGAAEGVRHRARLGLPLDDAIDEGDVLEAFELAARRTAPARFDALGERERSLAARQLERFADARDALIEELR